MIVVEINKMYFQEKTPQIPISVVFALKEYKKSSENLIIDQEKESKF